MITKIRLLTYIVYICLLSFVAGETDDDGVVLVVMLARNKAHTLPYFLNYFEKLNYPKEKLSLLIRSDHNEDTTNEILKSWLSKYEEKYHSVDISIKVRPKSYAGEEEWGYERSMNHVFLKEEGLQAAREMAADYIWYLDLDVFLLDADVLQKMIEEDETIIAPMLESNAAYSNFWGAMNEEFWYRRSDDYLDIVERKKQGCFPVQLVTSCVLVNLKHPISDALSFHRHNIPLCNSIPVPTMDIILFAVCAQKNEIEMFICNKNVYGYILIPDETKESDISVMKNFRLESDASPKPKTGVASKKNSNDKYIKTSENTSKSKEFDDYFDKIYCLHLSSKPSTKELMTQSLKKLGLSARFVDAFDSRKDLNTSFINSLKMKPLKSYDGARMTYGEVNQFLSHYFIWKEVVDNNFNQVIIFEDSASFYTSFKEKMGRLMKEIVALSLDWDFVYLGRKATDPHMEEKVLGSEMLVKPGYSHGTFGYILSLEGAKKLMDASPLRRMVPLQHFLAIMYDMHPEENLKSYFRSRSLTAFAVDPSVIEPSLSDDEEEEQEDRKTRPMLNSQIFDFQNPKFPNLKQTIRQGIKTEL